MWRIPGLAPLGSLVALLVQLALLPDAAQAAPSAKAFAATLASDERGVFEEWLSAQATHSFKVSAYWREVTDKRGLRRKKRSSGRAVASDDYIATFPPSYAGPTLPQALAKRWRDYQASAPAKAAPSKPRPGLDEFLAHAEAEYGFVPERVAEREFKMRYAREALALGLTKDQIIRIYALETSGLGTADMVAGVHPVTRKGTPISTAIGYAQLLAANSVDEIAKNGQRYLDRLRRLAGRSGVTPERAAVLAAKIESLKRMVAVARSVPNRWDKHRALARTNKGLGIHALNLDGDVGPWMQVSKVQGLKATAEKKGITRLSGSEIELMNLAGPATGLEMMTPVGLAAPTPNFFERDAYETNTIVRGKTSQELLKALDERMDTNIRNSGAIEFAEAFDLMEAERAALAR